MFKPFFFLVGALATFATGFEAASAQDVRCLQWASTTGGISAYYDRNFRREVVLATAQLFNPRVADRANVAYYFPFSEFEELGADEASSTYLLDLIRDGEVVDLIRDGEVAVLFQAENLDYYGVMTGTLVLELIEDPTPENLGKWINENNVAGFVYNNVELANWVTGVQIMAWDSTPYTLDEFSEKYGNDFPQLRDLCE